MSLAEVGGGSFKIMQLNTDKDLLDADAQPCVGLVNQRLKLICVCFTNY